MHHAILRRAFLLVPTVWGVVTIVFFLLHLIPGDPVDLMLGETALPADREALRQALGLDRPLAVQYLAYLRGLLGGDLGESLHSHLPVAQLVAARYPATVELAVAAALVAVAVALPLGCLAAARAGTAVDHGASALAVLGVSMPNFWLGPLLILLFAIWLGWLPVSGRGGPAHLVLPALTLGLGMAAIITRMSRAALLDALGQDYIRTARAKGLRGARILLRHGLRNALLPVITLLGLQFGHLLAGAVITETIFAWPGIGRLLVHAITTRDYPVVQGCLLGIAITYVVINAATDVLYAIADPRVRSDRGQA